MTCLAEINDKGYVLSSIKDGIHIRTRKCRTVPPPTRYSRSLQRTEKLKLQRTNEGRTLGARVYFFLAKMPARKAKSRTKKPLVK